MRLFIAITPPLEVQKALHRHLGTSIPAKWTPVDQIHMTLAFLGEQPGFAVPRLCSQLNELSFAPFTLKTSQIGHFRNGAVWMGLEASAPLDALRGDVMRALLNTGIEFENRGFVPHLTICRHRENPQAVAEDLQEAFADEQLTFEVNRFRLMRSLTRPTGAVHNVEAEFRAR